MIGRNVRFQEFILYEGWKWTGEGKIIAETEQFYKIKTGIFTSKWVYKSKCQEINYQSRKLTNPSE